MPRDRSTLGVPLGVDGPWLAAILAALDDLHALLDARLPRADGPVRIAEPAPVRRSPGDAVPVREPDSDEAPDDDAVQVSEPAPDPPPRAGRGASAAAWRTWAAGAGVVVADAATRDDIIAACEQAGVLPK